MQSSSGSSAGGAVKAISSQDYQSSLGLGPAQIGNASGAGGVQITSKSQNNNTAGNWMEEGSNNAQTKKAPGKGM
jgi:hypothetical protein